MHPHAARLDICKYVVNLLAEDSDIHSHSLMCETVPALLLTPHKRAVHDEISRSREKLKNKYFKMRREREKERFFVDHQKRSRSGSSSRTSSGRAKSHSSERICADLCAEEVHDDPLAVVA